MWNLYKNVSTLYPHSTTYCGQCQQVLKRNLGNCSFGDATVTLTAITTTLTVLYNHSKGLSIAKIAKKAFNCQVLGRAFMRKDVRGYRQYPNGKLAGIIGQAVSPKQQQITLNVEVTREYPKGCHHGSRSKSALFATPDVD
jgi:hypothetical protein